MLVASAYLKPGEIQDFADRIGEISSAAVGCEFKVMVRVEVGGDGKRLSEQAIDKINAKLGEVSSNLKLGS